MTECLETCKPAILLKHSDTCTIQVAKSGSHTGFRCLIDITSVQHPNSLLFCAGAGEPFRDPGFKTRQKLSREIGRNKCHSLSLSKLNVFIPKTTSSEGPAEFRDTTLQYVVYDVVFHQRNRKI